LAEVASGAVPQVITAAATVAAPAPLDLETVRTDLSDGKRGVKVQRIRGTTALFFKAKIACDADGAARAYHPNDDPEALDLVRHATAGSKKFIQGKMKNGKTGIGPRPGFFVSETSLNKGVAGTPTRSSTRSSFPTSCCRPISPPG
jgi:hypothetical protein